MHLQQQKSLKQQHRYYHVIYGIFLERKQKSGKIKIAFHGKIEDVEGRQESDKYGPNVLMCEHSNQRMTLESDEMSLSQPVYRSVGRMDVFRRALKNKILDLTLSKLHPITKIIYIKTTATTAFLEITKQQRQITTTAPTETKSVPS